MIQYMRFSTIGRLHARVIHPNTSYLMWARGEGHIAKSATIAQSLSPLVSPAYGRIIVHLQPAYPLYNGTASIYNYITNHHPIKRYIHWNFHSCHSFSLL